MFNELLFFYIYERKYSFINNNLDDFSIINDYSKITVVYLKIPKEI